MKTKLSFFFLLLGLLSQSQIVSVINGNLNQPLGVAYDPQGFLVVADTGHNAIVKFGSVYNSTLVPGNPVLNNPRAIAKGYEYMYVSDGGGVVKKINSSGSVIPLGYGFLSSPRGVALDGTENVYVVSGNSIVRMTSTGTNITTLTGGLNSPEGVGVNYAGTTVYVSCGDGTVKKVTNNGATVTTIASGISGASGLAIDGTENVFVADYSAGVIKKITPTGVVTTHVTGLQGPWGVAIGAGDVLFVTEIYTNQVKMINTNGDVTPIKRFHNPTGIAVDPSGKIYTTDSPNGLIKRMNSDGETISAITNPGSYNSPFGMAIKPIVNSIFIANTFNNSIDLYNYVTNTGNSLISGGIINRPHAIAVDTYGYFVANTNSNNILKIDGASISIYGNNGEFYMPMGITINGGHVFVADTGHQAIKKMTTSGNDITTVATGFAFPTGILVDSSGKIYVADRGNNNDGKIVVLSSTGVVLHTINTGLLKPYSITFDSNSDVLITDIGDNKIKKLNVASLSITEFLNENEVKIYPNPTTDFVQISSNESIKTVALFDLSGKLIMKKNNPRNEISLTLYPKGMYMMKIIFESGKTETRKIMKE